MQTFFADRLKIIFLSGIILDSTAAAEEIPSDARGRFIDNNGVIFQAYWFDEANIDWNAPF